MKSPTHFLLLATVVLTLASLGGPAGAQVFPAKPTPYEDTYFVFNFRCPYPTPYRDPLVTRQGSRIEIEVVTQGSICFTGNDTDIAFAVNLGRLEAGDYDVVVHLGYEQSTGGAAIPFAGGPQQRKLRVREQTPVRISGLWYDPAVAQQGLSFLLTPSGELVANWFTYASGGNPVWFTGQARPDERGVSIEMSLASGGRFAVSGGNPELTPFGVLEVDFLECGRARAVWRSTIPGFTQRTLNLVQASSADGLGNCKPDAITEWLGWR